jgi:hypothetical protein
MNFDSIRALNSGASLWQCIPDTLKTRYKTQTILMRADAEVLALDREKEPLSKDEALKTLLIQVRSMIKRQLSMLNRLTALQMMRLQIFTN